MEIKLYMKYPIIDCYPNHANLLSIISQNKNYLDWVFNIYLQLFADKNDYIKDILRLDFYTNDHFHFCSWINLQKVSRKMVDRLYRSFTDFLKDILKSLMFICWLILFIFRNTPTLSNKHIRNMIFYLWSRY
ncbi:hypothetical protein C173_20326 [Paenibacillus sp. FSL R7-277]|nr:hypothetical protein C173_20326 [Paenibacillus sp. FSL R7-277]